MIYGCINHTDAERQAATIGTCPVCTQARIDALYAELAAAREEAQKWRNRAEQCALSGVVLHAELDALRAKLERTNDNLLTAQAQVIPTQIRAEKAKADLAALRERLEQLESARPNQWLPKSITVSDIAATAQKLTAENAALRAELKGIVESETACGCTPICHCNDNVSALLAWKEATIEGAHAALAKESGK